MAKMLKGDDRVRWQERNLRENADHDLEIGDRIKDLWGRWSTITALRIPKTTTIENHGSITSVYDDGDEEHYAAHDWRRNFRVERRSKS